MIAQKTETIESQEFYVIHPLFDKPEQKLTPEGLGRMSMKTSVRLSLMLLQCYLILMALMVGYHLLDMAGILGHHLAK